MSHLKEEKKKLSTIIIRISWGESCSASTRCGLFAVFITSHLREAADGGRAAGYADAVPCVPSELV